MSNITVPYSVNRIDGHSSSYSKGNFTFSTSINLPKVQPTYLWFQHADQSADIYVDDTKVTTHWGGYGAFFTDISNYVHAGTNNIRVVLNNTTRNTLAPCSADFNFNATLGKVKVITSPVMPAMIYGYDGFHITATNVSSAAATLTIKTSVPVGATVVCKIDDDDSNYHFYEEKPSTGSEMSFITTITNPTLWNGKINPHLYNVTLEIYKNGDLYHRFQRGYGIRYYSYVYNYTLPNNETYTGFLLNGSPYLLRGVCMHDDLEGKANALDDIDYTQEFAMIQEVGCNFIRLAHYPHPKEVYDWCDRLGIIVQTEVPLVNNIKSTQPEDYYTHLEGQYYDMVTQHYNHPCIVFWGLGNEFNAQMDSDGGTFACTKLEHFRDIIKTYDTERMVGCVLNASSSNPRSTVGGADLDWYGCNIYVGWYSNTSSNNPTSQLNARLNNVTNRPIAYSEYGCGATQHCHSENPSSTTNKGSGGARHDIEYQMWYHEGQIAAIKNFPQLIFTSEWQFFDVAVSGRNEGYTICLDGETTFINDDLRRLNDKGLVERDHMTKKDTFYLYKAWWNQTDKFVHICGKDYEKLTNRVIKCYTNDGDSLTLYVNNTEIETVNVTNNIATFTARTFGPGDVVRVNGSTNNDTFTFSKNYLTLTALESGTFSFSINDIQYSLDNGTSWTTLTAGSSTPTIAAGNKIMFKASGLTPIINDGIGKFSSTGKFIASGNVMSLYYGDNYNNQTSLSGKDYAFIYLFKNCTKLISAENLILPATTLAYHCYHSMFQGCTSLTTAPVLPATTLAIQCYDSMFQGCTSLTTTPVLPATTLATNCYTSMFQSCTSLTTAPVLPATTLADFCYYSMFRGCTSLTTAPALPATTLVQSCYYNMFSGCTSLTTAPVLPATTLATCTCCYYQMFYGCTNLTTAPELPATTLADGCYNGMFYGCTSLTTAPVLPATTLTDYCYYNMFYGCTNINYIVCLATNINATNCTYDWVNGVSATGKFVKEDNMSSWTTGVNGIPTGWITYDSSKYEYLNQYLTFDIKSSGSIIWKRNTADWGTSITDKTIYYSKNDGSWTSLTSSTEGTSISVTTGDKLVFRGFNDYYATYDSPQGGPRYYSNIVFSGTAGFNVYGNILSLIYGNTFANYNSFVSNTNSVFYGLFKNAKVLSAENLILPVSSLVAYCYCQMFNGCTTLTKAPELPATTLAGACYYNMFSGCTSLTTVPTLPATTLAESCYADMFYGCSSLTTAPELPATTLASSCYANMFYGCSSLTTAPELPATTLVSMCYYQMFSGCSSLTTAPELPATTLTTYSYYRMFRNCTHINYIKCLANDITASYCTTEWVENVAATGTFVKALSMTGWTTGNSGIPTGWVVEDDYTNEYLTFDVKSDGNITWKMNSSSATAKTISYSKNNGTWTDITSTTSGVSISVVTGDKVRFKGSNSAYATSITYSNSFGGTTTFDVYGNIMSLIGGDNFSNLTTLSSSYTFTNLFKGCTGLTSAVNLILPATTLAEDCYIYMFNSCSSLTTAPSILPATTLANYCYSNMFYVCTSLTTAPELPATTLASNCYDNMFYVCTSLTTAPELPATTLTSYCYHYMFHDCTSLTTAPELPATTLADNCYYGMFQGCTSLTTAPELPATTLANSCYYQMFYNCTSLTTAPELPATTLVNGCYNYMFNGCTNLNYIRCLATDISASNCTDYWVNGVAATGTFVKADNMSSWTTGVNGIPTGWVVENYNLHNDEYLTFDVKSDGNITWKSKNEYNPYIYNTISYSINDGTWTDITATASGVSIPVTVGDKVRIKGSNSKYSVSQYNYNFFESTVTIDVYGNIMSLIGGDNFSNLTTISDTYTFYNLFKGCTGLISAENLILPATTLASSCYGRMFSGCTSLITAPELPATTLASSCYNCMFLGCTSLTTAPELPATTLASGCYNCMFSGCTSLITAPELPATTLASSCYASMFSGCTSLITAPELPAITLASSCYSNMFSGCTSLTSAPELPATTLADWCYERMFYGCSSLNYIKCLATNISAYACTFDWIDGVAATGTFIKAPSMSGWTTGNNGIPNGWTIEDDYTNEYLTFDIKSDGNITWKMGSSSATAKTISYSKNNGTWTDITSTTSGVSIPVVTGDKVRFKGSNSAYSTDPGYYSYSTSTSYSNSFGGTATFDVYGNIMSLIGGDNFFNLTTLPSAYTFGYLFSNCTGLLSSENLILHATTLSYGCYNGMFYNCTALTTAPELPATTLQSYCYSAMFRGCTSLNTAPELPVTTLANKNNCYSYMFTGCSSLTTAPELPATTLANHCYGRMFSDCTSLTTAPELPATTLETNCYNSMFSGCTSLNYIKCLATNISASNTKCTSDWVSGVSATGTFVKNTNMTGWTTGNDGIPTGWTVEDYVPDDGSESEE